MNQISYDDFSKVDIRIGTVLEAEVPDWSHWVMRLKVDFGEEIGTKLSFSGIMKFYKPEDLIGKQFPFVINLEPKKIGPDRELSEAMMIMATPQASHAGGQVVQDDEETAPILFKISKKTANGTKVR
ncbi:MAG: tRNA-binding protein [Candidatus Woesebacteria bacterium]|nr:MAG: tRNA-binding protein [Candidatus Woesebacteria bacterium]